MENGLGWMGWDLRSPDDFECERFDMFAMRAMFAAVISLKRDITRDINCPFHFNMMIPKEVFTDVSDDTSPTSPTSSN